MDKRIEECGEAIQAHFYAPYDSPEVSESVDSIVARHFAKWEAEQAELITRLADTVTKQRERITELESRDVTERHDRFEEDGDD